MLDAPFGTWRSPISASDVARGGVRLGAVHVAPDMSIWWSEGRPSEGGRSAIVRRSPQGTIEDVLAPPWNARTRVHEYGGGAWLVLDDGSVVFAHWVDQRLYRLGAPEPRNGRRPEPVPLTPEPDVVQALRYADLVESHDGSEVLCVRERSLGEGPAVARDIVAVALDGSMRVREVVSDGHFMSNPRPSPDGTQLAWLRWEHPQMPWDGTELRVAQLDATGSASAPRTVLGASDESVFQPQWADPQTLYALCDRTGWWNLYEISLAGDVRALCPREEEFAHPQWVFGMSRYAVLDDGRIALTHGRGTWALGVLDPASGDLTDVAGSPPGSKSTARASQSDGAEITYFDPTISARGSVVATVGGGPCSALAVLLFDLTSAKVETVRSSIEHVPAREYLPPVVPTTFVGREGRDVHAFVYPPTNPQYSAPGGEKPPFIAFVHGGPTSQTSPVLDMQAAYFTSRGIGVVDVDYGGSTGYGREYRNRLRGEWGIVDVEDVVASAEGLVARGEADPARLLIRGGSAGGWTVLVALTRTKAFAAGASYFGVAELLCFSEDTHDFESRYLDGLIGPLPEARDLYVERSPLSHIEELDRPILLLQGDEDKIVPPSQSELFRDAMVEKNIVHAYVLFEGEQHGFRRAETIERALEAELSFYGQVLGFEPPEVPVLALSGEVGRLQRS